MQYLLLFSIFLLTSCNHPLDNSPKPPLPMSHARGLVRSKNGIFGKRFFAPIKDLDALPTKFSWVDQGLGTPVRDQGSCGSCWAFATTQTLEGAVKIFDHKDLDLSEQQIVSCDKSFYGCNGGDYAGDFLVNPGQALESDFPYTASDARCKKGLKTAAKGISWASVGQSGRSPSTDELKQAIAKYGPVAVSVYAHGAWDSYHGGVYDGCTSGGANHLVVIEGWDDATHTWHLKNSWGEGWGDHGYMAIPYDKQCDGVGQDGSYVVYSSVPCKPPSAKLPAEYSIVSGDEIVLAVKLEKNVAYSWSEAGKILGTSNELVVSPASDTVYQLSAKNTCGELTIQTIVSVK